MTEDSVQFRLFAQETPRQHKQETFVLIFWAQTCSTLFIRQLEIPKQCGTTPLVQRRNNGFAFFFSGRTKRVKSSMHMGRFLKITMNDIQFVRSRGKIPGSMFLFGRLLVWHLPHVHSIAPRFLGFIERLIGQFYGRIHRNVG